MSKMNLLDFVKSTSVSMSVGEIIINMLLTIVISLFIFWVYKRTYSGVMYSKNFNITIVLISTVTAMVMMVIGSNLALSLGMVGALSIIRFRSAIKDPKDIGFLFWGIAAGLSAGTGSYIIAIIGSLIIASVVFFLDKEAVDNFPYLLIIKGENFDRDDILEVVRNNSIRYALKMSNTNQVGMEIIYEILFEKDFEHALISEIRNIDNVNTVNIISHKGEIAG